MRFFPNLPIRTALTAGFILFTLTVAFLLMLSFLAIYLMSGTRALVSAEGTWSRSRSEAVYFLTRYVHTQNENDYRQFQDSLALPLAGLVATQELGLANPNFDAVRTALVKGGSHPDDASAITRLFKWFGPSQFASDADANHVIALKLIQQLKNQAVAIHQRLQNGDRLDFEELAAFDKQTYELSRALSHSEQSLAHSLGSGAHSLTHLVGLVMGIAMVLLFGFALLFAAIISRRITTGVKSLRQGTNKVKVGRLDERIPVVGRDELSQLAQSFNEMTESLAQARQAEKEANQKLLQGARELSVATEKLEEKDRQLLEAQKTEALGRLASAIAHDFNNLLTAIMGSTEFAEKNLDSPSTLRSALTSISQCADRAASMTRRLLAFSRRQVLQKEELDLNKVVDNIEDLLERLITENITVSRARYEGSLPVFCDKVQLEQVIMNICVNARDAMPEGGKLTIETRKVKIEPGQLIGNQEILAGEYALLTVRDTGIGMDKHVKERLFEPFFTTKELGKGTGLGLATSYGIVRQHQGYIEVESEPGQGATFNIYFPLAKASELPDGKTGFSARVKDREGGRAATILVVDDEEVVRNVICSALSHRGYKILSAARPSEALQICKGSTEPIDLVLTDIVMPEMNGTTLIAHLKPHLPAAEIIYMTGYTDPDILSEATSLGDSHFIQKPFRPDELTAKISKLIENHVASS